MRERVFMIGDPAPLMGVWCAHTNRDSDRPAFILLNSGIIHRVGACRLSVELARGVTSSTGIPSFRFDYSGLGDSPKRRSSLDRDSQVDQEIIEVMDYLQRKEGISQFILYGLCSGARDAVRVAAQDSRVTGVMQMDGYAFKNRRYYLEHYKTRVFDWREWRRFVFHSIPGHIKSRFVKTKAEDESVEMFQFDWGHYPSKEYIQTLYRDCVKRAVRFNVVFTGSWDHEYNYANQFFDMFNEVSFGNSVKLTYMEDSDHVFSNPADRRQLVENVCDWLR